MPRKDYQRCRECGKSAEEVGTLSRARLCIHCSFANLKDNILGMSEHDADVLRRWRRGMAASVGAVLLDDPPVQP